MTAETKEETTEEVPEGIAEVVEGEENAEDEDLPAMKPREFAGAINRAKEVAVWVDFGVDEDGATLGTYLRVKKESARSLVEQARTESCDVIAFWEDDKEGGALLIGIEPDDGEETEEEVEEDAVETA